MITICQIDLETGGFAGGVTMIADGDPCPASWVRAEPPATPANGCIAIWSAGQWAEAVVPGFDLVALQEAALDHVGRLRWEATQFFQYDGARAWADSALGAVIGIVVGSQILPPVGPSNFKLGPGVFRLWLVDQITAYGIAIRGHIQGCFDREAELTAAILAAETPEAIAALVSSAQGGWPQ